MRTAADIIVASLIANGIDRVFTVAGESYLGLLDALYGRHDIDTVVCRHEAGAGFMALADARLTGRAGVACVSRGPGASNAAIAVHAAEQDGVPLVLIVGQVPRRDLRRDAFQEIDPGRMFGSIAKWTAEVLDAGRMGETLLRAFQVATQGQPGPVVIAVPEDVLTTPSRAAAVWPQAPARAAPSNRDLIVLRQWLTQAQRPLVMAGDHLCGRGGRETLRAFLERWEIPAVVSFRNQDLLPNRHRLYAGEMGLSNPRAQITILNQCDLLLVLGARLSDINTQGYRFPHLVPTAAASGPCSSRSHADRHALRGGHGDCLRCHFSHGRTRRATARVPHRPARHTTRVGRAFEGRAVPDRAGTSLRCGRWIGL